MCEARRADDFALQEYYEVKQSLVEAESGYASARQAAAKRATMERRQKRKQERSKWRALIQQVHGGGAAAGQEVRL